MAHLHLPADHDPTERDMARAVAKVLNSGELYVTWTSGSGRGRRAVAGSPGCRPLRRRGVLGLLGALTRRRVS